MTGHHLVPAVTHRFPVHQVVAVGPARVLVVGGSVVVVGRVAGGPVGLDQPAVLLGRCLRGLKVAVTVKTLSGKRKQN